MGFDCPPALAVSIMTVTRRITGHWLRGCHCCGAKQRGNNECCRILHSGLFVSLCHCDVESKKDRILPREIGATVLTCLTPVCSACTGCDTIGGGVNVGDALA